MGCGSSTVVFDELPPPKTVAEPAGLPRQSIPRRASLKAPRARTPGSVFCPVSSDDVRHPVRDGTGETDHHRQCEDTAAISRMHATGTSHVGITHAKGAVIRSNETTRLTEGGSCSQSAVNAVNPLSIDVTAHTALRGVFSPSGSSAGPEDRRSTPAMTSPVAHNGHDGHDDPHGLPSISSAQDILSDGCVSVASSAARPAREKKRYVSMKAVVIDEDSSDYFGSVARRQTTALSCFAPPSAPASPPKAGVVCEAAVEAMPRGVASASGLCLMPSDWRSPQGPPPPRSTVGSVVSGGGDDTASNHRLTPWHSPPRTPRSDRFTSTSETDLPLTRWTSIESESSDVSTTAPRKTSLPPRAPQFHIRSRLGTAEDGHRRFRRPLERHRSAERVPPIRASVAPFPCLAPPPPPSMANPSE